MSQPVKVLRPGLAPGRTAFLFEPADLLRHLDEVGVRAAE
jgi:hypothetical protein